MTSPQPLDWHLLHHAYGIATDVPALLEQVERFPAEPDWQSEPWFSLWSSLYHQGDIYTASIAAVPRIVSALSKAPSKGTLSFYLLPASIAIADSSNPVSVPTDVRRTFNESLLALGAMASAALPSISDQHIAKAAQAAVLVSTGAFQQAGELLEADA
jgi:hypothetical protein